VVFFSILAVMMALVATTIITLVFRMFGIPINMKAGLIISVIITLVITPIMSFYMVRLFLKVDKLEEEMRVLAIYDSLTGLLTKREFFERAEYFHRIALRDNLIYSLIIADLDDFKEINDQLGHLVGDKTLEIIGLSIQENLRESDLACRFGGDEFLFFLPNTSTEQANQFCDRFQVIIDRAIEFSSLEIQLTASMGIASFPELKTDSIEDLISAADNAMYLAKDNGRSRSQLHNL
jgi:diguanylate cyclase (GGDEF)-like protein